MSMSHNEGQARAIEGTRAATVTEHSQHRQEKKSVWQPHKKGIEKRRSGEGQQSSEVALSCPRRSSQERRLELSHREQHRRWSMEEVLKGSVKVACLQPVRVCIYIVYTQQRCLHKELVVCSMFCWPPGAVVRCKL